MRPAHVDETSIIRDLEQKIPAADIALELAQCKAKAISQEDPLALVIGADQILCCGGKLYQKVVTPDGAKTDLRMLRGQKHQLISAVCIVREAEVIWSFVDTANLLMKKFDDEFIGRYVETAGTDDPQHPSADTSWKAVARGCSRRSRAIISRSSVCRWSSCCPRCRRRVSGRDGQRR